MKLSDYEREQYEKFRDCPDVAAYYYCKYEASEEENQLIQESISRAREKFAKLHDKSNQNSNKNDEQ